MNGIAGLVDGILLGKPWRMYRAATVKLATAIFATLVSAGAPATSGTSAAQSEAVPELVVVWSGSWSGPRLFPDIIVYSDGEVIYPAKQSALEPPSIENWRTVTIDENTRQNLIAQVRQGLQKSENCNVFAPVVDDGPAPTIYLNNRSILVFPEKPGFISTSEDEARVACAEFQKVMDGIEALKSLPAQIWQSQALEFEIYPVLPTMKSLSPIQWPSEFPTEISERQIGRNNMSAKVLAVRVTQSTDTRAKALTLLKATMSGKTNEPVSIAGTQYRLHDVHEWLPGQEMWEEAIYRAWGEYLP